jgi:flagellar hook protein FlgE
LDGLHGALLLHQLLVLCPVQNNRSPYNFGYTFNTGASNSSIRLSAGTSADNTILSKSLEASNASMTQSVPELSLAQKLFSALTKVLQTKQTNVDGVLNLIR